MLAAATLVSVLVRLIAVMVMTAAATAFAEIALLGQPPQLKRLLHLLANHVLNLLHALLRLHKTGRDCIGKERLALLVELLNFLRVNFLAHVLLLMQFLALFAQAAILVLSCGIAHEGLNLPVSLLKTRIVENRLAQLPRFLDNSVVAFGLVTHKNIIKIAYGGGAICQQYRYRASEYS